MTRVEPPHLAGTWYERSAEDLARQTDALLARAASPAFAGTAAAIVVPHAAYRYSGATAAVAYRILRDCGYRRAVILAPSHFLRYRGAAVLDVDAFATPLGEIAVDRSALDAIAGEALIRNAPRVFRNEHALEIQLPLLQRVLPQVAIVPLIVGDLEPDDCVAFAAVLARLTETGNTVLIVSSDFTHYGADFDYLPFVPRDSKYVEAQLRALDLGAIEHLRTGDFAGFRGYVARTGATICGREPLSALLAWRQRNLPAIGQGVLLAYTTSLALTGDFEHSVSYAALAFARVAV